MVDPRNSQYPAPGTPAVHRPPLLVPTVAMGGVGLVVGAAGASAANIRRVKNGEIEAGRALKNVVRESAGAALATAAATLVVRTIGVSGMVSAAGMLAAATAVKYFYDGAFQPPQAQETAGPESSGPQKPAKKRSTVKSRKKPQSGQTDTGKEE